MCFRAIDLDVFTDFLIHACLHFLMGNRYCCARDTTVISGHALFYLSLVYVMCLIVIGQVYVLLQYRLRYSLVF